MGIREAVRPRALAVFWTVNQTAILNLAQTLAIVFTIAFAIYSHHAESNGQSAQFMLKFSEMLDSGKSGLVATELDEKENLDKFTLKDEASDDAIDHFLSNYEMLNVAYENHLINKAMVDDAFSWELEKAVNDRTIRHYISLSKAQADDMFDGVLDLARAFDIKFAPILPFKAPVAHGTP